MKVLTVFDCYGCHDVVEVVVMRAGGSLIRAHTYEMARAILSKDPPQLVICDRALDDGKWQDLLDFESVKAGLTLVVVTSRLADEKLWAEVLNLGGYDVLVQPLDEREVTRLVGREALA
jgi:DNA-binding NtrC family response regulator